MDKKIVLIADDNKDITDILSAYIKKDGYDVVTASDGSDALGKFDSNKIDLVILDVMMPKIDGFQVCKDIRKNSDVPIIMVTARSEDMDKIMGLEIGADDYIVKPFNPAEVLARVKAIMRRIEIDKKDNLSIIRLQELEIDMDSNEVKLCSRKLNLTRKEIDMLWLLASNPNKVFSRDNLLNSIWGYDYFGDSRTVDTHMTRLRSKLETTCSLNWEIKTIWGIGYKLEVHHD